MAFQMLWMVSGTHAIPLCDSTRTHDHAIVSQTRHTLLNWDSGRFLNTTALCIRGGGGGVVFCDNLFVTLEGHAKKKKARKRMRLIKPSSVMGCLFFFFDACMYEPLRKLQIIT